MQAPSHLPLFEAMDPPYPSFARDQLGVEFPRELALVSRLWFQCGYRPGIGAYLNFFLLKDFTAVHDEANARRFRSLRSMANSFYQTDLFIRDVTDSGALPTGGISSRRVRDILSAIMARHQRIAIPLWMMTYFGFSLLENVEKQCGFMNDDDKRLHLAYMAKAYRIMGVPFSDDREQMERCARSVEEVHAGLAPQSERHIRNILMIGEMVGVSSDFETPAAMLPEKTREVFRGVYPRVCLSGFRRGLFRGLGSLLMKQAVGKPRAAVPSVE